MLAKFGYTKSSYGIKAFTDLHSCTKLLTLYIQQHFLEVVEADEFLSLSSEQLVQLISSDMLKVPSEEKVDGVDCVPNVTLNSVECYNPSLDAWIPVSEMSKRRYGVGVGVLDGSEYL